MTKSRTNTTKTTSSRKIILCLTLLSMFSPRIDAVRYRNEHIPRDSSTSSLEEPQYLNIPDKPDSKYDWYDTFQRLMSFFVPRTGIPLPVVQKPEVPTRRILREVDETKFNPALSKISEEGRRRQIATKILNTKLLPSIRTLSRATPHLKRTDSLKKIDYMRLRKIKRSTMPSRRIKRSKNSQLEKLRYNPPPCVPGMDKRIPCIEVSEDFFDDDDFDVSSYGAGGDFDPRLLKQMNFADRDNNGEGWEYYMRL